MKRGLSYCIGIFILSVLFYLPVVASGSGHFPEKLKIRLNRITEHIYNDRFEAAADLINALRDGPNCGPEYYLFQAVLYQLQMKALESDCFEQEYFLALDSLEAESMKLLERGDDSALAYYYLGQSHAFRSLYLGLTGHTWGAIKGGLAARKAYSKGYKIDSTFHDIALGLGSYRYWKSVKTKLINWTPIFKNEKQNGIDLLRRAAEKSEISGEAARASLIWVYINEERFAEAIRLIESMRQVYPDGLTFLWAGGEAYYKLGDYRTAAPIYENLLTQLSADPGNYFNVIEAAWYLSRCYREQLDFDDDYRERLRSIQETVGLMIIPEETQKRQKKRLKEIGATIP